MTKVERTRLKILQSTYILIVKKNDIPTMRQIARDAGVGLGSIYYHFKTNTDIFTEIDRLSHNHISRFLLEKTEGEKNPLLHFFSVEILRLLFLASREAYRSSSIVNMFLNSQFTRSRAQYIEDCFSRMIMDFVPFTITSYSGQYVGFMYEWLSGGFNMSVYEMMTFHFTEFFRNRLAEKEITENIAKVRELGEQILRNDLALPWINTEETQLSDDIGGMPLNRFDRNGNSQINR